MTSKTPWVSDRLPPKPAPQQRQNRNEGKKKGSDSHKSQQVQKLEDILEGLRRERDTRNPAGGCFCQAHTHSLSKYTPNCMNCGLVLCTLHIPFHLCPHCSISLLTPSSRNILITQIEEEITKVLKKEEEERIREQLERERAAGAFPTLATATGTPEHRTIAQSRNVLSINSKTRKVMVSSFVTPPPQSSSSVAAPSSQKKEVPEPRPPGDVDYVKGKDFNPISWKNLRDSSCVYVPLPPPPKKNPETARIPKAKKNKKADILATGSTSQS